MPLRHPSPPGRFVTPTERSLEPSPALVGGEAVAVVEKRLLGLSTSGAVLLPYRGLGMSTTVQSAAEFFPELFDIIGRLLLIFPPGRLPRLRKQEFGVPVHGLPPSTSSALSATVRIPEAV